MRISIDKKKAAQLCQYLEELPTFHVSRSTHWSYFGQRNLIEVNKDEGVVHVHAGAGFDSEYELNFRPRSLAERVVAVCRVILGKDDNLRFRSAFGKIWAGKADPALSLSDIKTLLGAPVTAHKALAGHYVNTVFPYVQRQTPFHYLEIGAGSGYFSVLMRKLYGAKCFIVDLPEILPFAFLLAQKVFPEEGHLLPHETGSTMLENDNNAFIYLAPSQLDRVPDASIDLAVNTASFGEMLPDEIARYFLFMRRVLKRDGLFYTANREEKYVDEFKTLSEKRAAKGNLGVRFEDYPWSAKDKDVFFKLSVFHELVQPQNAMFSRLTHLAAE